MASHPPALRPISSRQGASSSLSAGHAAGRPATPGERKGELAGCLVHDLREKLRGSGLRPTRQRVALGWLLFGKGDRHVTAERLFEEASAARVPVSLATVYNTLHQFTQAGLLREIAVDGAKTYFDTNLDAHHHFLVEGSTTLMDIPGGQIEVGRLPDPPPGMMIDRVDVVVRLKPVDAVIGARRQADKG